VTRDVPGSLEKLITIISANNANIISIQHDRMNLGLDIRDVMLRITCEVASEAYGIQLVSALKKAGHPVVMSE